MWLSGCGLTAEDPRKTFGDDGNSLCFSVVFFFFFFFGPAAWLVRS